MQGLPLHPVLVHIPVGLAALMPLLAILATLALARHWITKRAWAGVVLVQLMLFAGGLAALETGEHEEERVERVVSERAIHEHQERAERLVWAAGVTLAVGAGSLALPSGPALLGAALATTLGTFVVAGTAVATGHSGGELVYKHGAAAAYAKPVAASAAARARRADRDDDD